MGSFLFIIKLRLTCKLACKGGETSSMSTVSLEIHNRISENLFLRLREAICLEERKYTDDGYLIVSELSCCPYFEKARSASGSCSKDCYFCTFSDFRKPDYIERIERETQVGVLYSVCHNEKNKLNTNLEK